MQEQQSDGGTVDSGHTGRSRALAEGAHFGAYVIEGLLGSGGLARVYRARHATLGHEVALKVFEPSAASGPAGLARFFREAQLAAAIRHPHVVRTLDAGVHEGEPFVVMEVLEGVDLETRLRSERTVEELALIELVIPIAAGLMALHRQGLVHGDLGPGNIFLVPAAHGAVTPKVLDIGISKPHRGLRLTAAARQRSMGSPLYLAPEALLGRELTPASDQYSLGMLLYECVTGVNPFIATSLKESVRLIISGKRLPVLEQATAPSPGLAEVIERASSVAPEERFADLAAMGRALLRLADQRTRAIWEFSFQSSAAAPAGPAPVTASTGSNSLWKAAAVALAVLGWGTAGIVALHAEQRESAEQYVWLGATSAAPTAPEQRQFALRASSGTPAPVAVPCVPGPASTADAAASGDVRALSPSPAPALPPSETLAPAEGALSVEIQALPPSAPPDDTRELSVPQPPPPPMTPRGTNNAPIFE